MNEGEQASIHFAIAADPTDADLLYLSGDRLSATVAAAIYRVDTTGGAATAADDWTLVVRQAGPTPSGDPDTNPHADSRDMVFDPAGNVLYESSDGGIYRLANPRDASASTASVNSANPPSWRSLNGNLRTFETGYVALDPLNNVLLAGIQDNGSAEQRDRVDNDSDGTTDEADERLFWRAFDGGDGFNNATAVEGTHVFRYSFGNNWQGFLRREFDAAGAEVVPAPAGEYPTVLLAAPGRPLIEANHLTGLARRDRQIVTQNEAVPIQLAINPFNPARLVVGYNGLYESSDRGDHIRAIGGNHPRDPVTALAFGGRHTMSFAAVTTNLTVTLGSVIATDGPNTATHAADNVESLIGELGDDLFAFSDGATLASGAGRIDARAGTNTLDYSAYTTAVSVNLSLGTATGTSGVTNFQNVLGGSAGDTLVGSAAANRLLGFAGADNLVGLAGNDTLFGGSGNDALDGGLDDDLYIFSDGWGTDTVTELPAGGIDQMTFALATTNLTISLASVTVTVAENVATHSGNSIESVTGGAGDDRFAFAAGAILASGAGKIDGGGGSNTLDYSAYTTAVAVNLSLGTATGTAGVHNIQNVIGGSAGDTLIGSAAANRLVGNAGADKLTGMDGDDTFVGGAGNDVLDGGAGADTVDFSAAPTSVKVSLLKKTASGDGKDQLLALEAVISSMFADQITGDNFANTLIGGGGNDKLTGLDGADVLDGGAGNDAIDGGVGNDTAFGGLGNDNVRGGVGNDLLIGGLGADLLRGDAGDDVLDATIDGDLDQLIGGPGLDAFLNTLAGDITRP